MRSLWEMRITELLSLSDPGALDALDFGFLRLGGKRRNFYDDEIVGALVTLELVSHKKRKDEKKQFKS